MFAKGFLSEIKSLNECKSNFKVHFLNYKWKYGIACVWKQKLMGTIENKHVLRKPVSNKQANFQSVSVLV